MTTTIVYLLLGRTAGQSGSKTTEIKWQNWKDAILPMFGKCSITLFLQMMTLHSNLVRKSLLLQFSSSHVQMWELDHKEGWAPKNWWFWIVVLEKTLEIPVDCKEIKPVNPKGNQLWIFIGRTDAEFPTLWPSDVKSQLIGKDPDAGKDWGQEKKGATEDEIVGWHHGLSGHELSKLHNIVKDRESRHVAVHGITKLDTT